MRYGLGKVLAGRHCSLCDLTHRGLRRRPDWDAVAESIGVPLTLLHRNELDARLARACGDGFPCVLSRRGTELDVVLDSGELDACGGDVREFERRLQEAVRRS
jgi:hypothetical protein